MARSKTPASWCERAHARRRAPRPGARPSRALRVGTALLDLLALAFATRLDRVLDVPSESRRGAMKLRVQAFIEHHLGDPDLSPASIGRRAPHLRPRPAQAVRGRGTDDCRLDPASAAGTVPTRPTRPWPARPPGQRYRRSVGAPGRG